MVIVASNCASLVEDAEMTTEQTDQLFFKPFCELLDPFIVQCIKRN